MSAVVCFPVKGFVWLEGADGVDLWFPTEKKVAYLEKPLRYRLANGEEHSAPVGLRTDGTSLPPVLWPMLGHPFDSDHCRESIVHDSDYQKAPPTDGSLVRAMHSPQRAKADAAFREALHANPRLTAVEAEAIFRGVRLFGWWAWRRHARNNVRVSKEVLDGE